jgi:hypothetical protein
MARDENKNEIIEHEWTTLKVLWDGCRDGVCNPTVRAEIEALFPKAPKWSSEAEDWHALNLAEQRVGEHLTQTQLRVEYQTLLDIAKKRKIASLVARQEADTALLSDKSVDGVTLGRQRAVYLSFLQILQAGFIEGRFRRRLGRETAMRLFYFGLIVSGLALLPPAIYLAAFWWTRGGALLPGFGLVTAATFGILGAYFSRVMSFQSKLSELSFDDVMNVYQWRMLLIRLLYGMIGAVIFYFVLLSGLVGGAAFPSGDELVWGAPPDGNLAKLIVWSFLAGFSERLVPDTLERTEGRATKADG